ncbi:MAG: hypothetical protein ACP5NS_00145 [Candidatus Pacearchaeota archaeon]
MRLSSVIFITLFVIMLLTLINFNLLFRDSLQREFYFDTYTRALCSGQTCRDFVVSCKGSEIIDIKPISGFVTFGRDWEDRRVEKYLC